MKDNNLNLQDLIHVEPGIPEIKTETDTHNGNADSAPVKNAVGGKQRMPSWLQYGALIVCIAVIFALGFFCFLRLADQKHTDQDNTQAPASSQAQSAEEMTAFGGASEAGSAVTENSAAENAAAMRTAAALPEAFSSLDELSAYLDQAVSLDTPLVFETDLQPDTEAIISDMEYYVHHLDSLFDTDENTDENSNEASDEEPLEIVSVRNVYDFLGNPYFYVTFQTGGTCTYNPLYHRIEVCCIGAGDLYDNTDSAYLYCSGTDFFYTFQDGHYYNLYTKSAVTTDDELLAMANACIAERAALEAGTVTSGVCGDNLTWSMDDEDTLTISGTGPMYDYEEKGAPWAACNRPARNLVLSSGITTIGSNAFMSNFIGRIDLVIPDGVTSIGDGAFRYSYLRSVTIPDSVTSIGSYAFEYCMMNSLTMPASVTTIGDSAFTSCIWVQNINYGGTMEAWEALKDASHIRMENAAVQCSDGSLAPTADDAQDTADAEYSDDAAYTDASQDTGGWSE